jgi:peroxiredoxin (alkyl hydroperoxide reductase subunit C)
MGGINMLVGNKAPFFESVAVFSGEFKDISLNDYKGQYVILFFYPLDFTFVCPTELHAFQERLADFNHLGATVLACSIDSQFTHKAWLETPREKGGIQGVKYALITDVGGRIARNYGVLHEESGIAYRGLFLIDREGTVRHQSINDLPLGRNVGEILRILEALQHVEEHGDVCPANWTKERPAIKATLESVGEYLQKSA